MFKDSHNKKSSFRPIQEEFKNTFKIGLDLQRETYKDANINSDYDTMITSLENIYNETISKVKDNNDKIQMRKVSKVINWYYNLPFKYTQKTQHGMKILYPPKIEIKIKKNFSIAYRILLIQLNKNKLI